MKSLIAYLIIPNGIAFTANAVTLRNHVSAACGGNSMQCDDWPENQCCGITRGGSTRFSGLPPLGIGSIHRAEAGNSGAGCGNVLQAGSGLDLCLSGPHRGSMWNTISNRAGEGASTERNITRLSQDELAEEIPPCESVAPPTKIILSDGHEFFVGNDTESDDVQRLMDLILDIPFATIDDVPETLHGLRV